jgi:hypothetical protein
MTSACLYPQVHDFLIRCFGYFLKIHGMHYILLSTSYNKLLSLLQELWPTFLACSLDGKACQQVQTIFFLPISIDYIDNLQHFTYDNKKFQRI